MLKGLLYQQLLLLHLYDHSTATHQLTKHFEYEHTDQAQICRVRSTDMPYLLVE